MWLGDDAEKHCLLIYQETPDISEGLTFSHYQSVSVLAAEISMFSIGYKLLSVLAHILRLNTRVNTEHVPFTAINASKECDNYRKERNDISYRITNCDCERSIQK